MVFFGQWGLPFGVPKSRPLTVVVGSPLEVPRRAPLLVPVLISSVSETLSYTSALLNTVSDLKGDGISSSNVHTSVIRRTPTKRQNDPSAPPLSPSVSTSRNTIPTQTVERDGANEVYEPSDAEVEGYLETFIMALEKLYEDNSKLYGMGHVKLVIM